MLPVHRRDKSRGAEATPRVAIGRVELLYPFPQAEILSLAESYPNLEEVVWVQEEPRNMGARAHMSPRLMQILPHYLRFGYIGRGLSGRSRQRAEPHHHHRARHWRGGLPVPAQGPWGTVARAARPTRTT